MGIIGFSMSRLTASNPRAAAEALTNGFELIARGSVRPDITVVESLGSVAPVHDLLAGGLGRGKYVVQVGT